MFINRARYNSVRRSGRACPSRRRAAGRGGAAAPRRGWLLDGGPAGHACRPGTGYGRRLKQTWQPIPPIEGLLFKCAIKKFLKKELKSILREKGEFVVNDDVKQFHT